MDNFSDLAESGLVERAHRFRALHSGGRVLVLPNAWDAGSARIVEDAGAAAVATTSSGAAWGLGSPDGEHAAREEVLALVARIVSAVGVPVTVDMVAGYAQDAAGVAETVRGVLAAGAVGINIEDSQPAGGTEPLRAVAEQAERIAAAREAADAAGVPLFVNARVDVFLRGVGGPAPLTATLERAAAYVDAGADGIFVPGVTDTATVSALARGLEVPLGVLAGPGAPSVAELAAAGAARVSVGGGIAAAAYSLVRRAATELLTEGSYKAVEDGLGYMEMNGLFDR